MTSIHHELAQAGMSNLLLPVAHHSADRRRKTSRENTAPTDDYSQAVRVPVSVVVTLRTRRGVSPEDMALLFMSKLPRTLDVDGGFHQDCGAWEITTQTVLPPADELAVRNLPWAPAEETVICRVMDSKGRHPHREMVALALNTFFHKGARVRTGRAVTAKIADVARQRRDEALDAAAEASQPETP